MDHDQRLKTFLREFFADLLMLFFPEWAVRFDLTRVEWVTQEIFADPPSGERRRVDLVAKLSTRGEVAPRRPGEEESWLALLHAEIEGADGVATFRGRMYDYYCALRKRDSLPVLPIALYLRVGLDGIGVDSYGEDFWELPILNFQYLYVGLPALPAEPYVAGDNRAGLALAALMCSSEDRKAWLRAEALRRIDELPDNNWRCVKASI